MKKEKKIAKIFINSNLTLAIAESCTGGSISSSITDVPGASKFFKGGIVAYSNDVKVSSLDVPGVLIKKYGAVSPQVASLMAEKARKTLGSDVGVAITGIAGPSGGTKKKPVGLAYLAFASKGKKDAREVFLKGNGRKNTKERFTDAVFDLILDNIK
ncbi:MAG: CinA family protein [Candidatus Omnitrophica bacterium]|nr:CinA family protein [Candidatus Omnitrophota bacterium]